MSFSQLNYHIVWSTKNRESWFNRENMAETASYIGGIIRGIRGTLFEANGPADHIHIAAAFRPTVAIAEAVNKMKSNSSKWFKERFRQAAFDWQDEYAAFSVSPSNLPQVIGYIRNQVEHHRKQSFTEELKALLRLHEIPFEEKYLL